MNYYEFENKIILENFTSFKIDETLECGQCFRFNKLSEKEYVIIAYSKVLHIRQLENKIEFFPTTLTEFEEIWINYFDLNCDYDEIKNILSKKDDILKEAIKFSSGIRILNQNSWECLISFIISQNNRIPMIKQVIKNISEKYGTKQNDYYLFPTLSQLSKADETNLISCKTGFRAKYILDAIQNVSSGNVNFESLKTKSTDEAREKLMEIKGVGKKVADCVLLFSMNRRDTFPTDVWIKRVMEHFYFNNEETSIKEIHAFAKDNYGKYAGYAQQYLFNYARQMKIGAKK